MKKPAGLIFLAAAVLLLIVLLPKKEEEAWVDTVSYQGQT